MRKIFLPFLLLAANFCFGQVDLNLGLRAYYPFSGNANDVSGNNNNPVFNNATLTADRFGNPNSAYHFNGTDNFMQIPNSPTLNMPNQMSVALLVKATGYYTGPCYNNMLVTKSATTTLPSNFYVRFADVYNGCTNPTTTDERFSGNNTVAPTPIVQLNEWYSVVWTSDGVLERIYVNCELKVTAFASGVPFSNGLDMFFGKQNSGSFPYWLNGDLDEIRIYDRALNQDEVNTLGGCVLTTACNNWLSTPTYPSYATAGDIDVAGNQITVEATYNRTAPLNGGLYPGHLVSKHTNVSDVNYALLPNGCSITTTDGYKETFETCGLGLNKTYHVAMVYDGSFLKFYRNGFLMTQVACTGNMITNNLLTTIAQYAGGANTTTQFLGNINEVRIWNVARTPSQLQTYMNSSLPNPTTQTGLQAYYTFNNLVNQQGNNTFNAILQGGATTNATNPNCTFVADSCVVPVACSNWLRTQAVGQSVTVGDLDISGNQITVEANFNCSSFPITRPDKQEDIVSKHATTNDINYVLRMDLAGITTTNGQFLTPLPCDNLALNKTYHVAMVYNGSSLKFYRDGFLMSQVPATGNLILNNWQTTIGDYAVNNPVGTNFLGYINEVRIWNVARTQAQIQTYMNASLPAPTTQTGLQGYYTFDNLLNKQGNPAWNGTLNGGATINNSNPNCTFVADSCTITVSCNTWLNTPTHPSTATIGNLNVTGNKITVEANFNCTAYNFPDVGGKLVSKHTNAANTCYALSPHAAELSTSDNGYVVTYQTCTFQLNKTYHTAMVYDGASLKFYRDGFLMSQIPCTGNISTNNLLASIGNGPTSPLITQFFGHINEIRIWNVARTQTEIQTYMNSSLPNPTTQTGLLAYYTFDNQLNKQGNAAWNATLNGGATINATNPNCTFIADSCPVVSNSIVINDYTPVLALNPCNNTLTVEDGTAYNVGDTVLLIQMKGAIIDSTNTAAFGTITDYKNSGNYEYNYVKSKTGNTIELINTLTRQYDIPVGKVQLIRVPYYINLTTTDTLTCLPWDGNKGGVLVFDVQNTLTLNADVNVSGKGFNGGVGYNPGNASLTCNQNDYNYPINTIFAAQKGESITTISNNIICGKGNPAAGGGGGLGHNSGGGGGGNGGVGGLGGYQLEPCGNAPFDNRGIGGSQLAYSAAANKIYLGSGGGAGHADNPGNIPPGGGNGAGIIIISADTLISNAKKITANGGNSVVCSIPSSSNCHDATGGGGAGGTILLSVNQFFDNALIENKGGKAADVIGGPIAIAGRIGPGGGGAGGVAFIKAASMPANLTIINTGGINGVLTQDANNAWGATSGTAGQNIFNLVLPVDNVPFKTNIDSVRIKDSILSCNDFDFKGMAYVNTNPIASWQWYFGDGGQATTQNTSHAYAAAGSYTVQLIVTDINGCIDSTLKDVNALPAVTSNAGTDASICSNTTVSLTLNGTAVGGPYLWSPAIYLNNPNIQNPVATISSTTTFYLNVTGSPTCTAIDSVTVTINPVPLVDTRSDTTICRLSALVLNTNSNATTFQWSPPGNVSNPNIANPNFTGNASGWMYVTGYFASGCSATDSLYVTVNSIPVVDTRTDTAICISSTLVLNTNSDATTFQWSPAASVSNPTIASPNYISNASGWVYVTGYFASGCAATDSLYVTVNPVPFVNTRTDTGICRSYPLVLNTSSNATSFQWSPATSVSNPAIANPNFIGNISGWVYVTGYFASGCSATDSLYVTINPTPIIDTRTDTAICRSSPLILNTNSDATTILWSPAASVSNPNIANPNYIGTTSGWVYVTGSFASGCAATDSLYVTVNQVPFVDTRTDTSICRLSPLVLTTNSDATIFQWSPAASVSNPTIANPNYTGNTSGWVYVIGSSAAGCFAKDSLYVTVNQLPVVQTIADSTICLGESITLTTTGAQTYSWNPAIGLSNPGIASPVFSGSSGQNYTVTGTGANGCKNTDLVSIIVVTPPTFKAPPAFTICEYKSVTLDGNNGNQFNYLWSPATYLSNANIRNPIANPPQTTLYTLLVTEKRCGFDSTFTTLLTVLPAPVINARKSNDIDCALRSATLFASGGNQYLWSPSTGLNNATIANPVAIPATTITYTVLVTNGAGCTNTDSVTVFKNNEASLARYMPNAFTPDGNGINDCYGLKNWMYIQQLQFYIFNRFGEQVFGTANPNVCWNGTYKGKPALAGTYVYVIKAQTKCGLEEQKGSFLLIR